MLAQTGAVRRFVFPPFLAFPRSSRGVDLLAVHNYILVLYQSGTHIHSWHSDFFLWPISSAKPTTSQHTATTAGLFLDVSVAGIIGAALFTTTRSLYISA